jgi:hypothetical protein
MMPVSSVKLCVVRILWRESATVVGRFRRILQAREVKRNVWYSIDDQEIKECVYESFYDIVVPQDVLKVSCHLLFDSLQAGLDYDYFISITFALIILGCREHLSCSLNPSVPCVRNAWTNCQRLLEAKLASPRSGNIEIVGKILPWKYEPCATLAPFSRTCYHPIKCFYIILYPYLYIYNYIYPYLYTYIYR